LLLEICSSHDIGTNFTIVRLVIIEHGRTDVNVSYALYQVLWSTVVAWHF